ncbi:hypothetical protein BaRGS_00035682, partial [Batillaria attramentaria]
MEISSCSYTDKSCQFPTVALRIGEWNFRQSSQAISSSAAIYACAARPGNSTLFPVLFRLA